MTRRVNFKRQAIKTERMEGRIKKQVTTQCTSETRTKQSKQFSLSKYHMPFALIFSSLANSNNRLRHFHSHSILNCNLTRLMPSVISVFVCYCKSNLCFKQISLWTRGAGREGRTFFPATGNSSADTRSHHERVTCAECTGTNPSYAKEQFKVKLTHTRGECWHSH